MERLGESRCRLSSSRVRFMLGQTGDFCIKTPRFRRDFDAKVVPVRRAPEEIPQATFSDEMACTFMENSKFRAMGTASMSKRSQSLSSNPTKESAFRILGFWADFNSKDVYAGADAARLAGMVWQFGISDAPFGEGHIRRKSLFGREKGFASDPPVSGIFMQSGLSRAANCETQHHAKSADTTIPPGVLGTRFCIKPSK